MFRYKLEDRETGQEREITHLRRLVSLHFFKSNGFTKKQLDLTLRLGDKYISIIEHVK